MKIIHACPVVYKPLRGDQSPTPSHPRARMVPQASRRHDRRRHEVLGARAEDGSSHPIMAF